MAASSGRRRGKGLFSSFDFLSGAYSLTPAYPILAASAHLNVLSKSFAFKGLNELVFVATSCRHRQQ
jgi:hypothetical protein